jgi:hypothetical protein
MTATRRYGVVLGLAAVAALWPVAGSQASVGLQIQITGLGFQYHQSQGGSLYDSGSILGGNGSIAEGTRVSSITFFLNGALRGTLPYSEGLYADFLVSGVNDIPKEGGAVTSYAAGPRFGFDLLSSAHTPNRFLALDFNNVTVTYTRNEIDEWYLQLSFIAVASSALMSQDLPFGLALDPGEPITVRISSLGGNPTTADDGTYLTDFSTNVGTGNVWGSPVPEPASFAALLVLGVASLEVVRAWNRRRHGRRLSGGI